MSLISYLTRIHFADRVLEDALEPELARLGIRNPLLVTDRPAAAIRLRAALPDGMAPVLHKVAGAVAREEEAAAAARLYRAAGADGVIGLGGAAALDIARAAGVAWSEGAGLAREAERATQARPKPAPVIAVPTTSAGGAGLGTVAMTLAGGRRVSLTGPALVPAAVICDPTLALDETAAATAAAGMDALIHCLETYLATAWNPPADGIALDGLGRAAANLQRAVKKGRDLGARREMLAAALNGGLAQQKGLGGVHALSHAIEEAAPAPAHGSLHALILPRVLAFNAPAVGGRYRAVAAALGLAPGADPARAIAALGARVGLPARLGGLGIAREILGAIAERAEADPANRTNPRLAHAEDYRAMLEEAW